MTDTANINDDELVDYDEEEEAVPTGANGGGAEGGAEVKLAGGNATSGHVGIHASGFRDFLLKPELLRAIVDCGFEHPSQVQYETLPTAMVGMDVLCQAKSGMGKTAVFTLASLHSLEAAPAPAPEAPAESKVLGASLGTSKGPTKAAKDAGASVLVLCHTRELAFQIAHEYERFTKYMPEVRVAVFYGGIPVSAHKSLLAQGTPQVVVGTPGRILALIKDGDLRVGALKTFIIDECDKVLETLDMRKDIQAIFQRTPHSKQTMMFSATLSKEIRPVCRMFMQDPTEIYVDDETKLTLHGLQQYYVHLPEEGKNRRLNDLLDSLEFNQVVIFVKSVSRAVQLNELLTECNFPSIAIHSGIGQEERIKAYKAFKSFEKRILVATNIFGRGIDIERVNIVVNYDMPEDTDTYLHRVGRAGRFGTKGLAVTFVSTDEDEEVLKSVQERFVVTITELPATIAPESYMTA